MNHEDSEEFEIRSISVGDNDNIKVAGFVSLIDYMRQDGMTGIGFHFEVFDLATYHNGKYVAHPLHVVLDNDDWVPELLGDLLDYFRNNSKDPTLDAWIEAVVQRYKERNQARESE